MIDRYSSFINSLVRQQQELELRKVTFDIEESRYDYIFSIKVSKFDNRIVSYMALPFDYEMSLNEKEVDTHYVVKLGKISQEQVKILNDVDLQDTYQFIKYNKELNEVQSITIDVQCITDGSYYDDKKSMWILPASSLTAEFKITPIINKKDNIVITNYYEFSVKSMEKRTFNMQLNDSDEKKVILENKPQTITANIVGVDEDQIFRVKLKEFETSTNWITSYICFKSI